MKPQHLVISLMKTPLTPIELYEFDLTGYIIIRNFLSQDRVRTINRIIDRKISGGLQGKFSYFHLDSIFCDLMADPRAVAICRYLIGDWFRFDHAFGIQYGPAPGKGPPTGHEGLHAGPFANQGSFRYSWFDNRPHCGLIVFSYFLEPVRPGDGGLILVPGSHKLNVCLTGHDIYRNLLEETIRARWIDNPEMNSGDLLIFTEAVIHGTRRWEPKDRRRRNIHISYAPGYQASRDYDQIRRYLPLAKTDLQRALLRPPHVLRFNDEDHVLGENEWRTPVM
jgi:hypothetical protein